MEKIKHFCKIVAIYSNVEGMAKTEYAVNLAAALSKVTAGKVKLVGVPGDSGDTSKVFKSLGSSGAGIDVLILKDIKKESIEEIRNNYQYIIIDIPAGINESVYEIFTYSDAIHFFVDSTRSNLENGHRFLEDLRKKGLERAHKKLKVVVYKLNIFDKFSIEEMSWLVKRDIWAVVPESGILDPGIDSKGIPLVLKSGASEYSRAVLRIAKMESGKLLGIALGSGAALGLAHIGVLKVLEENHISADIISGSSIGALIASMWGLGFSSGKIERIAKKLTNKLNIVKLLDFTVPISGILAGKRLRVFLKDILGEKTFEDLQIPVKIMVYDLANRQKLVIEKGLLADAVYMSVSVPGIFKPKVKKERMIIDGGVADPVPIDILLKVGVKKIIAVNVLPGPEDICKRNKLLKDKLKEEENLLRSGHFYIKAGIFLRKFFRKIFTPNIFDVIMTTMQSTEYILAEESCKKADIALHPVIPSASSTDFHLVKNFIKKAEEETTSRIEEIKELVNR